MFAAPEFMTPETGRLKGTPANPADQAAAKDQVAYWVDAPPRPPA
jgi:hypothetical protein